MKKIQILFFLLFSSLSVFSEIPESLLGIWEGKDRYVFFEKVEVPVISEEENFSSDIIKEDRIVVILKTYYGWYLDRAAEAESYSEKIKRDRNIPSPRKAVYFTADAVPLWRPDSKDQTAEKSAAYELKLTYEKHDISFVPIALLGDSCYLKFWLQSELHPGFWKGNVVSEGIKISNQSEKENLWSWYISPNTDEIYKIRYWKSKMDYDSEAEAVITTEDGNFNIEKHLMSADNNYSCVPGRRVNIRNLDKRDIAFDGAEIIYNEENTIAVENNIYLKRLLDKNSFEDLIKIVKDQNSKRKPDPPPLFPPEDLDFHWDLIDYLEQDNLIIQEVRKRQKDFGSRGKDLGH